jgi:hypothetical protein
MQLTDTNAFYLKKVNTPLLHKDINFHGVYLFHNIYKPKIYVPSFDSLSLVVQCKTNVVNNMQIFKLITEIITEALLCPSL